MREDLRKKLAIQSSRIKEINAFLLDPKNEAINAVLDIVEKYGGPKEINRFEQELTEARGRARRAASAA